MKNQNQSLQSFFLTYSPDGYEYFEHFKNPTDPGIFSKDQLREILGLLEEFENTLGDEVDITEEILDWWKFIDFVLVGRIDAEAEMRKLIQTEEEPISQNFEDLLGALDDLIEIENEIEEGDSLTDITEQFAMPGFDISRFEDIDPAVYEDDKGAYLKVHFSDKVLEEELVLDIYLKDLIPTLNYQGFIDDYTLDYKSVIFPEATAKRSSRVISEGIKFASEDSLIMVSASTYVYEIFTTEENFLETVFKALHQANEGESDPNCKEDLEYVREVLFPLPF